MVYVHVCEGVCEGVGVYHVSTKTPDRKDLKLSTVVVFDTVSKPIDFGSKGQGSRAQSPLTCVFSDCRQTRDEETLPLPIFIHADDVVRRSRSAFPEGAHTFQLPLC